MRSLLFGLVVFLTACATPYGDMGFAGGVEERRVSERVWEIRADGNGFSSQNMIEDFVLLKAAEIAFENGFSHFVFLSEDSAVHRETYTSGTSTYSGTTSCYGGICNSFGTISGPSTYTVSKPSAEARALFFTVDEFHELDPANAVLVSRASEIWEQLAPRHVSEERRTEMADLVRTNEQLEAEAPSFSSPSSSTSSNAHTEPITGTFIIEHEIVRRGGQTVGCYVKSVSVVDDEFADESALTYVDTQFGIVLTEAGPASVLNVLVREVYENAPVSYPDLEAAYILLNDEIEPANRDYAQDCTDLGCVGLIPVQQLIAALESLERGEGFSVGYTRKNANVDLIASVNPASPYVENSADFDVVRRCFDVLARRAVSAN